MALWFYLFFIFLLYFLILIFIFTFDIHFSSQRILHVFDFLVDQFVLRLFELVQEQESQVEAKPIVLDYLLFYLLPMRL
jgi:hypothetical protein